MMRPRSCVVSLVLAAAACLSGAPAGAAEPPKEPTADEVEAMIKKAGETKPDWWDSVKLDQPQTLNLQWKQVLKGWQPNHNLGAHFVSTVYPNPQRWRYGVKLLDHTLTVNAADPVALKRSHDELGRMWGTFLGDPARAAFWWRKGSADPVRLADCYRRLGARAMATAELRKPLPGRSVVDAIKQWAELGDLDAALRLADQVARAGQPDTAYLAAGNACRFSGDFKRALEFYKRVTELKQGSRGLNGNRDRAARSLKSLGGLEAGPDLAKVRDGTHKGSCQGFRGPVEVSLSVQGGKITEAKVSAHRDDWCGRAMTDLPARIVEVQGIKGVDAVSQATISSEGVINAAAEALKAGGK